VNRAFIKAILILPGTALVYIPSLIVFFTRNTSYGTAFPVDSIIVWMAGLLFATLGLCLMIWTMTLFRTKGGGGSPAPWDLIKNLIIEGPYCHVSNPMLTGVILALVAEALLLQSLPLFVWAGLFFLLNTIYFMKWEEPELEGRYGTAYTCYKKQVPRWLPRWAPYQNQGVGDD